MGGALVRLKLCPTVSFQRDHRALGLLLLHYALQLLWGPPKGSPPVWWNWEETCYIMFYPSYLTQDGLTT